MCLLYPALNRFAHSLYVYFYTLPRQFGGRLFGAHTLLRLMTSTDLLRVGQRKYRPATLYIPSPPGRSCLLLSAATVHPPTSALLLSDCNMLLLRGEARSRGR
jgi:hypothetical protein